MSSARRRGLDEVFHYFIPEEEQREARRRASARAGGARWGLIADPLRPLDRSLTVDLAFALLQGVRVEVVAPFAPPSNTPPGLRWVRVPTPSGGAGGAMREIEQAIRSADPASDLLAALPPDWADPLLPSLAGSCPSGVFLPVEATPWALRDAVERIDGLASFGVARIGTFAIGADPSGAEASLLRELGQRAPGGPSRIEPLGSVVRDTASFRSLLLEVPVLELAPDAESARSLRALARRILGAPRDESRAL